MGDYRVYCLDGAGRIALADWIEAEDDEQAIGKARALGPDAHSCEIWQRQRLVARVAHDGEVQWVDPPADP